MRGSTTPYTQTTLGWRRLASRSASRSRSAMAALLAVPSLPLKNRLGFRHLMATSLLCHLPRYTCKEDTSLNNCSP